jgi:hypothetical protein
MFLAMKRKGRGFKSQQALGMEMRSDHEDTLSEKPNSNSVNDDGVRVLFRFDSHFQRGVNWKLA